MKTVAGETEEPQTRSAVCTAQLPLLEVRVKPLPDGVAVKVAQVPAMYHVPALMMQPFAVPPEVTCRVPFPEKGVPGAVVGLVLGEVVVIVVEVVGEAPEPDLGRYLTPVAGQSDEAPSSSDVSRVKRKYEMRILTWVGRDESSRLNTALDIVEIPNLVQLICILALNDSSDTPRRLQRCQYIRRRVRRR